MSDYLKHRIGGTKDRVEKREADAVIKSKTEAAAAALEADGKEQRKKACDEKWEADALIIAVIVKDIAEAGVSYIQQIVLQHQHPLERERVVAIRTNSKKAMGGSAALSICLSAEGMLTFPPAGKTRALWHVEQPVDVLTVKPEDYERILMDFIDLIDPDSQQIGTLST